MTKEVNPLFITKKPKSPFLEKYIAYYYFHNSNKNKTKENFIFYPNTKNALTIYKSSSAKITSRGSSIKPDQSKKYICLYSSIQKKFKQVEMHSPFNKIGIVFQPLGFNYFINKNLCDYMLGSLGIQEFGNLNNNFYDYLDQIYESDNPNEKVKILDHYFSNNHHSFNGDKLEQGISLLHNSKEKYSVQSLADELSLNRKSLLRLFQKHLCCSVKDYINVIQFRKALHTYQNTSKTKSLTNHAYENNYYDQSQFIRHFKKMTGYNPKKLFSEISQIGNEDTLWCFK